MEPTTERKARWKHAVDSGLRDQWVTEVDTSVDTKKPPCPGATQWCMRHQWSKPGAHPSKPIKAGESDLTTHFHWALAIKGGSQWAAKSWVSSHRIMCVSSCTAKRGLDVDWIAYLVNCVISFFKNRQGDLAMRLAKLDHLLIFRRFVRLPSSSQALKFDNQREVTRVPFTDIGVQLTAEKPGVAFRQIGLKGNDISAYPFRVCDWSDDVPIALGHLSFCNVRMMVPDFQRDFNTSWADSRVTWPLAWLQPDWRL